MDLGISLENLSRFYQGINQPIQMRAKKGPPPKVITGKQAIDSAAGTPTTSPTDPQASQAAPRPDKTYWEDKNFKEIRDQEKRVETAIISPTQHADLMLRLQNFAPLQDQERSVEQMKSLLNETKKRSQYDVDMTPLLQFGDFMTGGHFDLTKKYGGLTEGAKGRQKMISELAKIVEKGTNNLNANKIAFMRSQLRDMTTTGETTIDRKESTKGKKADSGTLRRLLSGELDAKSLTGRQKQQAIKDFVKTPGFEKVDAGLKFLRALNIYENSIKDGIAWEGEKASEQETKYNNVAMAYKEANELGAITGPDLDLMMQAIRYPNIEIGSPLDTTQRVASYKIKGGLPGIKSQIEALREIQNEDIGANYEQLEPMVIPGVTDRQYKILQNQWNRHRSGGGLRSRAGKTVVPKNVNSVKSKYEIE